MLGRTAALSAPHELFGSTGRIAMAAISNLHLEKGVILGCENREVGVTQHLDRIAEPARAVVLIGACCMVVSLGLREFSLRPASLEARESRPMPTVDKCASRFIFNHAESSNRFSGW